MFQKKLLIIRSVPVDLDFQLVENILNLYLLILFFRFSLRHLRSVDFVVSVIPKLSGFVLFLVTHSRRQHSSTAVLNVVGALIFLVSPIDVMPLFSVAGFFGRCARRNLIFLRLLNYCDFIWLYLKIAGLLLL